MCTHHKEERPIQHRCGQVLRMTSALVMIALTSKSLMAQGAQAGELPFRARVVDQSDNYQRITVPLNRSVTVEMTVEMTRADVIAQEIADVQVVDPKRLLITGRRFGTTTIVLLGKNDEQNVFEVSVELDLQDFNAAIAKIDPLGSPHGRSVGGNIILTGVVTSAERAQRMMQLAELYLPESAGAADGPIVQNHMEIAGEQQVLLRCVVAEVGRAAARELGVNGFLTGQNFKDGFVVNQLNALNPINIGAAAESLITENVPFFTDENGISISDETTFSLGFPRVQMQLFLKAMVENSLLRVLAEPNLVAISGETATFLAGGEFPYTVPQGNQQVTIEFKEYGIQLDFTPIVRGQQIIRLKVTPTVSQLDFTNQVKLLNVELPALTTRSASTVVEVGNGQTIAIAGLLNEQINGVATMIPGIGELPVLGALFRSVRFQRAQTELVILVTPEIVAPLEPHQKVRMPGEDIQAPGDFDLYALGLLEPRESYPPKAEEPESRAPDLMSLHGPWGHAAD